MSRQAPRGAAQIRAAPRPGPGARTAGLARLDPRGLIPLYHRIMVDLTLQIRSGSWRPGQEIPSEVELCRHYDVSRGTIRRAVAELVQQGLVYRRQGSGSFVSQPKLEGSVLGSYREYRKEGVPFDVDARVLRCERRPAPPEIGRILGISSPRRRSTRSSACASSSGGRSASR